MNLGFYFKTAFRRMWQSRKYFIVYSIGIILTISVISSVTIWSVTSENLAVRDFLRDSDYELRVRSYILDDLPDIQTWLENHPLVESVSNISYNQAFFNAENKDPLYEFYPFDDQADMINPVSVATLLLPPNNTIKRIKSQFNVIGNFSLELGEVLISEQQAERLELVFGQPIVPGMKINLSVCRNSVDFGTLLFQYQPTHFYNVTVKGIYRRIPSVTMLQKSFSEDFLDNSIIFLYDNLMRSDKLHMLEANGLYPLVMAKCDPDKIASEGIDNIIEKLTALEEQLNIEQTTSLPYILFSPIEELQKSYGRANTIIMVMIPVAVFGVLQALFAVNIIIEKRKDELAILKERGALTIQIMNSTFLEFSIVILISVIVSGALSFLLASLIPSIGLGRFSAENFTDFFSNLKIHFGPYLYTSLAMLVISLVFVGYKVNKVLPKTYSERDLVFRDKLEKWISLGLLIASTLAMIIYFIIFGVKYRNSIVNVFNFNDINTVESSYVYLFISIIIILSGVLLGIAAIEVLSRLRIVYSKIFKKSGFFIAHNFKKSKHSLNSILIIVIILSGTLFFSLTLRDSYKNVESATNYYNNGSDFRIETDTTHHTLELSLILEDGIDDAMSVLRTAGSHGYDQITLFGVDAGKYASMGRWIENSFINDPAYISEFYLTRTIDDWLSSLNLVHDGIIISDGLAREKEKFVGDTINLTNILIGGSTLVTEEFTITGIIHSAPGFGLASGENLDLNQPNDHFALINFRKANEDFGINNTNLVFASLENGYQIEEVENTILSFDEVLSVNPDLTSAGFTDRYINNYVPELDSFIIAQVILLSFLGMIIIVTNISYIISNRKRNSAILSVLGNTPVTLTSTIFTEILLLDITSILAGLAIGLPLGILGVKLLQPYFLNKVIYPVNFALNGLYIVIVIFGIIIISLLAAIPSLIKLNRSKAVDVIQNRT